uniref:Uncharacterized protein n=1 Tax=Solanum tuberosum TaxID=4113 RepID=M1E0T1_SOLTU
MICSHGLCRLRLTPTMNDYELWLLKNALLSVGGGMGLHPCIAQVGFESSHGVFLYVIIFYEMNMLMMMLLSFLVYEYEQRMKSRMVSRSTFEDECSQEGDNVTPRNLVIKLEPKCEDVEGQGPKELGGSHGKGAKAAKMCLATAHHHHEGLHDPWWPP